jgi:hypothetical protein
LVHKEPDIYKACLGAMICSHGLLKTSKQKYEYSLQDSTEARQLEKIDYIKQILVEMNFSFILLLALGAVIDFHVEL